MKIYCQFRSFDSCYNYIFKNMQIKLGRISDSNDPGEIKTLNMTNEECNIIEQDNYNLELNAYLNSILKMTCFVKGIYDFDSASEILKAEQGNRSPFFKPKMWALYGSNQSCDNAGICIVFNENIISQFEQLKDEYNIKHGCIHYDNFLDEMIAGNFSYNTDVTIPEPKSDRDIKNTVQSYLENNYQDVYMQKDEDWSTEDEYRLLCWNKPSTKKIADTFLDFDTEDVEAVILGYNFGKNSNYKDFIQLLLRKGITIYKLGLLSNIPALKVIRDPDDDELQTPILELYHEELQNERKRLLGEEE